MADQQRFRAVNRMPVMPALHLKCNRCHRQVSSCFFVGQQAVCKDCYGKQDDTTREIVEQFGWFEFTIGCIALLIVFALTLWAAISGSLELRD